VKKPSARERLSHWFDRLAYPEGSHPTWDEAHKYLNEIEAEAFERGMLHAARVIDGCHEDDAAKIRMLVRARRANRKVKK